MSAREFDAAAGLPEPQSFEAHRAGREIVTRWIREQEQRTNAASVLVTDTFQVDNHDPLLGSYQHGSTHFTTRSAGDRIRGPVLAYRPGQRQDHLA